MTVRLLCAYSIYPANAIVTLDAATEAGLVGAKMASTNTVGGTVYVPPVAPNQLWAVKASRDSAGNLGKLVDESGAVVSAGAIVATLTGKFEVDGDIVATLPVGYVGTLQFTRSTKAVPPVKTPISGAVANAVNSLVYKVQQADGGFTIGCDASNVVSPSLGMDIPIAPAMRVAGDRSYINQASSTSSKSMGGYRTHQLGSSGSIIELEFWNGKVDGYGNAVPANATYTEVGSGGPAVWRSQIEYNGIFYPVLFNGSLDGVTADNERVVGRAAVPYVANTPFKEHTWQNQTGAGFVVHGGTGGSASAPTVTSTAARDVLRNGNVTDQTATGNWASAGGTDATGNAMGAVRISIATTKPAVMIIGTSIDHGEGGTQATVFNSGLYGQQLSDAGIGVLNAGVRADALKKFLLSNSVRVAMGNSSQITAILIGGMVNDVTSPNPTSNTASEIFANIVSTAALFPSKIIVVATMTPIATNAGGQTPHARAAVWAAVNNMIRNNAYGWRVIDIAAAMCPAGQPDSCIWATTGLTADGVHPNNAGYQRIRESGVVNTALFQ